MINPSDLEDITERLEKRIKPLSGANIFLTGGTGFFGKWLVESFSHFNQKLSLNARLTVLSRDPGIFYRHLDKYSIRLDFEKIEFLKGDAVNFEFPRSDFSHVIHVAAPTDYSFMRDRPAETFDIMIRGSSRALELARLRKAEKFLFISSGAVYGKQYAPDLLKVTEQLSAEVKQCPIEDVYGFSKQTIERLCLLHRRQYGTNIVSARCFAFVGAYLPFNRHYAAGNFIRDALSGNSIHIKRY